MELKPSSTIFTNGIYRKPLLPNLVFVNPEPDDSDNMDFKDLSIMQKARRQIAAEKTQASKLVAKPKSDAVLPTELIQRKELDGESMFSKEISQIKIEQLTMKPVDDRPLKESQLILSPKMNPRYKIAGQGVYRKPLLPNLVFVNPEPEDSNDMDFEDLSLQQKARRWIAEEIALEAKRTEEKKSEVSQNKC